MLRIGLIGDTQGRYRLEVLVEQVRRHFADVDQVWHAGDWQDPRVLAELAALGRPLEVVNGNAPDDPRYPERLVRRLEGLTVGMVHQPPSARDPWAEGCDIVIHGHTHRWRDEVVGNVRYISVSTPTAAGFSQDRTLGILIVNGDSADLERIVLEQAL